jgi:hypothetical protein
VPGEGGRRARASGGAGRGRWRGRGGGGVARRRWLRLTMAAGTRSRAVLRCALMRCSPAAWTPAAWPGRLGEPPRTRGARHTAGGLRGCAGLRAG